MNRRPKDDVDRVRDEAFPLAEDYGPFSSGWHAHAKHQLLYAARGTMTLTVDDGTFLLAPQRAAWISAGTRHMAASERGVELRSIYFAPALMRSPPSAVRVFSVPPLAREMILHAMRPDWRLSAKKREDHVRSDFLRALGGLCAEWMVAEEPLFLPAARSEDLAKATAWLRENLGAATLDGAARAARISSRTLARRFDEEALMPFRSYLQTARILRSMELLSRPRASVSATAYAVGFQSLGAFTVAFRKRAGETPTAYRARMGFAR